HDEDPLPKIMDLQDDESEENDEFESDDEEEDEDHYTRDWQELAGMGPNTRPPSLRHRLGKRDVDVQFDWHASYQHYGADNIRTASTYLEDQKRLTTITDAHIPDVNISNLIGSQRRVFLKVMSHYRS